MGTLVLASTFLAVFMLLIAYLLIAPILYILKGLASCQLTEFRELLHSLAGLADRLAAARAAEDVPPHRIEVPDVITQLASAESEEWAAEDLVSRARELYGEFQDGTRSSSEIWATVMSRLQRED